MTVRTGAGAFFFPSSSVDMYVRVSDMEARMRGRVNRYKRLCIMIMVVVVVLQACTHSTTATTTTTTTARSGRNGLRLRLGLSLSGDMR